MFGSFSDEKFSGVITLVLYGTDARRDIMILARGLNQRFPWRLSSPVMIKIYARLG